MATPTPVERVVIRDGGTGVVPSGDVELRSAAGFPVWRDTDGASHVLAYDGGGSSGGSGFIPLILPAGEVFTVEGQGLFREMVELGDGAYFDIADNGMLVHV